LDLIGILDGAARPQLNVHLRFDILQLLPPELRYDVLSFLSAGELLRLATVSKQWNTWAEDTHLWHRLFNILAVGMKPKDQERETHLAVTLGWKQRLRTLTCLEWDPKGCQSSIKQRGPATVVSKKDTWESVRMGRPIQTGGRHVFRLQIQLKQPPKGSGRGMPGGVIFGFCNQKVVTSDCMKNNTKKNAEVEAFYYEDYPHPIWRDEPLSYFRKRRSWNLERQHVSCFRIREDSTLAKNEIVIILDLPCCYGHSKADCIAGHHSHNYRGRKAIEVLTYHRSFTIDHVDLLNSIPVYFTVSLRNAKVSLLTAKHVP